jgi:DNA-binding transcriptional ArsR family regulator
VETETQATLFPVVETGLARKVDPETSKAAAKSVAATDLESLVLATLRSEPLTTHEISRALGIELVSISPRTAPLLRKGLIEDSGLRREGPSGRKSIVWRLSNH